MRLRYLNQLSIGLLAAMMGCTAVTPQEPPPDSGQPPPADMCPEQLPPCAGVLCPVAGGGFECVADIQSDLRHCGACNRACQTAEERDDRNAIPYCKSGTCGFTCKPPFEPCGIGMYCSTTTTADPRNCGGCGIECKQPQETCTAGKCVPV